LRMAGADGDRVISSVSGIGFLGAGVIMKEGTHVRGLNTAATCGPARRSAPLPVRASPPRPCWWPSSCWRATLCCARSSMPSTAAR
jgi:hypothetical protein